MDHGIKKRMWILAAATVVGLMCGPAPAINGDTWVLSCACATTANFAQAAGAAAKDNGFGGTYLVMSTTNFTSAYISVQGGFVFQQGETFWKVSSKYPVDESGNSLAANTETQNQSYFAALDETVFGADRTGLAAAGGGLPAQINLSPTYQSSFINSIDEEIGPGIDAALASLGINWASSPLIKEGIVVTVLFPDKTKAQFVKYNGKMSDHWVWNGKAWNKDGKLILRDGTLHTNGNTGGSGGGTANFNYNGNQFRFGGGAWCTWTQTITVSGEVAGTSTFVDPC
jgi:hypothetical protein